MSKQITVQAGDLTLTAVAGNIVVDSTATLASNVQVQFGTATDYTLEFDGTDLVLDRPSAGTGRVILQSNTTGTGPTLDLRQTTGSPENSLWFTNENSNLGFNLAFTPGTGGMSFYSGSDAYAQTHLRMFLGGGATGALTLYYGTGSQRVQVRSEGTDFTNPIYLNEQAAAGAGITSRGQLWTQTGAPNILMFTDDAGTDFAVAGASSGAVSATGTPLDNQVAVFTDGTTIEGDATLTWNGSTFSIDAGGSQIRAQVLTTVSTIGGQDETDYDNSPTSEGTFVGGTGFVTPGDHGEAITLSDGTQCSIVTVAAGAVTQFSIGTASRTPLESGTTLTQTSVTGGSGTGFSLTPDTDNVTTASGAQLLLPQDNDEVTPTLAFGDGDTGFYERIDDEIRLAIAGTQSWFWSATEAGSTSSAGGRLRNETTSATNPTLIPRGDDADTGIGQAAADQLSLISGGVEMLRLVETGTATTDQVIIGPAGIIGTAATPALAFGDGDTGFYESADDTFVTIVGGETAITATLDAGIELYWNNNDRLATLTNGSIAVRSDTSADSTRKRLDFEHADGTLRGYVGLNTDNFIYLHNDIDGAGLILTANDAGGAARTFLTGDPDAATSLTGDTELRFYAGAVEAKRIQAATVQTPEAAQTEILAVAVASGTSVGFEATVMGRQDATGDTVLEKIVGLISNEAGTTALIGTPGVDRHESAGASTWVITTAADDTSDELTFDVTGEASHTIDWQISLEIITI